VCPALLPKPAAGGLVMSAMAVASLPVGEFVDAVASDAPVPGGGGVSATVVALAAGLAAMAGRFACQNTSDPTFGALVERADALRTRALLLADDDAAAYGSYVEASRLPREPGPAIRVRAMHDALDASANVPYQLATLAAEVADIGEQLAVSGNPNLRSDACTATLLASAAAGSAAVLVSENLRKHPGDPRVVDSASSAAAARAAAERVLATFASSRKEGSPR
jgi:methenyltetrahydrofolate cyclohydrolase